MNNVSDSLYIIAYLKDFGGDYTKTVKAFKLASEINSDLFYCLASARKSLAISPKLKGVRRGYTITVAADYAPSEEEVNFEKSKVEGKVTTINVEELYIDFPTKFKVD